MNYGTVPRFQRFLLPRSLVWQIRTEQKELFLTFDDGPIPEITPWVLNVLDQYNAKATFFCVGENVFKHPEIFRMLVEKGHSVGNHTYNHLKAWKSSKKEYLENISSCDQLVCSKLFRPPHGQITPALARELNRKYSLIMWSVLSRDYDKNISPEECFKIATKSLSPGSIIVFHDSHKAWKNLQIVLPLFMEHCTNLGFTFSGLK